MPSRIEADRVASSDPARSWRLIRRLVRSGALLALDPLPLLKQVALDGLALEHVRVAAHELLGDAPGDVAEVELALLARELRVDHDLEEEVTELIAKHGRVAAVDRLERLVGLLEQVRPKRGVRLLAVPGTAVGCAQPIRDARQAGDRRAHPDVLVAGARSQGCAS